jgi:hypothetical protein
MFMAFSQCCVDKIIKESWPQGPGFDLPQRGLAVPILQSRFWSDEVMEWWSNGKTKK